MILKLLRSLCICLILCASFIGRAEATFISIIGEADFKTEIKGDSVLFTGSYKAENQGDEPAANVFPKLQIGTWAWAGEPTRLDPKKAHVWKISQQIPLAKLQCETDGRCAGLNLPLQGIHPVFITRHYQDLNGYEFSAVDFKSVVVGDVGSSQLVLARVPDLNIRMDIDGDGSSFEATAEVQNNGSQEIEAAFSYLTPREFRAISQAQTVQVAPGTMTEAMFSFENFKGLVGSSYAVIGVLQWEQGGIRVNQPVSRAAKISEKKELPFGYILVGVLGLCLVAFCFYVFRES